METIIVSCMYERDVFLRGRCLAAHASDKSRRSLSLKSALSLIPVSLRSLSLLRALFILIVMVQHRELY